MTVVKTEMGHRAMKDRSVPLTPRQRSAFIMFDGKRTIDQVLAATATMGVTQEDIDHMLGMGLLADSELAALAGAEGAQAVEPPSVQSLPPQRQRTPQERYSDAYPLATKITASLGLRGFRLNLAVEAAGSFEQLLALSPRIREVVGEEKFAPLDAALNG